MQNSFLTSDDVAKGPPGTNVPMAIKFSPDGMFIRVTSVPTQRSESNTCMSLTAVTDSLVLNDGFNDIFIKLH